MFTVFRQFFIKSSLGVLTNISTCSFVSSFSILVQRRSILDCKYPSTFEMQNSIIPKSIDMDNSILVV